MATFLGINAVIVMRVHYNLGSECDNSNKIISITSNPYELQQGEMRLLTHTKYGKCPKISNTLFQTILD